MAIRMIVFGATLTGTLMLPTLRLTNVFVTECDESQPCTHNPLGAKGCGEAGSIGAPAAVVSAALDALAGLGVIDLEMPITSEQIWRRIGEAGGKPSSFLGDARAMMQVIV